MSGYVRSFAEFSKSLWVTVSNELNERDEEAHNHYQQRTGTTTSKFTFPSSGTLLKAAMIEVYALPVVFASAYCLEANGVDSHNYLIGYVITYGSTMCSLGYKYLNNTKEIKTHISKN
jgi:hypothetical protein